MEENENTTQNNSQNYLTYGSIVSLMLDHNSSNSSITLSFDPNKNKNKNSNNKIKNNPEENNKKKTFSNKKLEMLKGKDFLFTQGIFNDNCFFYNFKSESDVLFNYLNTLFLIIPPCEYESLQKIKDSIKTIRDNIFSGSYNDKSIYQKSTDIYIKFKQEILTNHEQSINMLEKKICVNFGDSVQFLHLASGKFLNFKKNSDDLKIYIKLSPKMSSNTIFRILNGFNYQSENSTKIFFNLGIKIACGDKNTNREKYLANGNVNRNGALIRPKNLISSLNLIKTKNFLKNTLKISKTKTNALVNKKSLNIDMNNSNVDFLSPRRSFRNSLLNMNGNNTYSSFGMKIPLDSNQVICDDKSFNQWQFIKFSNDYLYDENFINSLDFFWIENCEKEVYLSSTEISENQENNFNKRINVENDWSNLGKDLKMKKSIRSSFLINTEISNEAQRENLLMDKQPDKEEKLPDIEKGSMKEKVKNKFEKLHSNHNDVDYLKIPLNYFYDEQKSVQHFYKLGLSIPINDNKDPLGIFKFEIVNYSNDNYEDTLIMEPGLIKKNSVFRIKNILSNKYLCVENNLVLSAAVSQSFKLINYSEIEADEEKKNDSLFMIETAYEQKKKDDDDDDNDEYNVNKIYSNLNNNSSNDENMYIKKNDTVRIKSKNYLSSYLAVRQVREEKENKVTLLLTKNLSDLTIFKLSFLNEYDKYELYFLEKLNLCYERLIDYFKLENKESIDIKNYENITHILIILKTMIEDYKMKKENINVEENKSLDLLRNLNQFDIIYKLMELFLNMWFKNYKKLKYEEMNKILVELFENDEYSEYLNYKKIVTHKILKIIKMIYDLDSELIVSIQINLHYFFLFIGYIDKVTKFLIHILKNNHSLLLKLLSLDEIGKNSELYEEMKNSLNKIIKYYNDFSLGDIKNNFKSYSLFFELLNVMLMCDDEPFHQFYDAFFINLNLIKDNKPNIEDNCTLINFYIKNKHIYIKKKRFFNYNINENINLVENEIENNIINNSQDSKDKDENYESEISDNDNQSNIVIDDYNKKYIDCDLTLVNYKSVDCEEYNFTEIKNEKEIINKIISFNILLYSNLSLHNVEFKEYLTEIFNMEIVNSYFNEIPSNINNNIINNNEDNNVNRSYTLNTEIKCSLIRMINFLYLKINNPLVGNMGLCRNINKYNKIIENNDNSNENKDKNLNLINNQFSKDKSQEIEQIINNIEQILQDQISSHLISDSSFLLHVFESCQYIMRHIYNWENTEKKQNKSFNFISLVLIILESYIGEDQNHNENNVSLGMDKSKNALINLINGDKLVLSRNVYIISNQYIKMYENFRKDFEDVLTNTNLKEKKKRYLNKLYTDTGIYNSTTNIATLKTGKTLKEAPTETFGVLHSLTKRNTVNKTNAFLNQNKVNKNKFSFNEDNDMHKKEIVIRISNIFLEFLKYIENEYINRIENNLIELKKKFDEGKILLEVKNEELNEQNDEDDNNEDIENYQDSEERKTTILMNDIIKLSELNQINYKRYYEKNKKKKFFEVDKEDALFQGNNLDLLKKFSEVFYKKKYQKNNINRDDAYISIIFFRCIHKLDIMDLKIRCFEILYRLNSQNFIFFENLSNLVIFDSHNDLKKFENIKSYFLNLFVIIKNIFSTSILDTTIKGELENFSIELAKLNDNLYDKKKWILEMDVLKNYSNIKLEVENNLEENDLLNKSDNNENSDSNYKKISSNSLILKNAKNNNDQNQEKDDKNKSNYFLNNNSLERIQLIQQVLFNLGFESILTKFMQKSNDIINKFTETKPNDSNYIHFNDCIKNILKCLEEIYNLLSFFIRNNKKHQKIIEEQIEVILFPIKLTNKITKNVMISLSIFLIEFLRDFNLNELNNVENFIKLLTYIINYEWKENKDLIPYWIEILKIVIQSFSKVQNDKLIDILNKIKNVLVDEIIQEGEKVNEDIIISLKEILELIISLKNIYLEDYEVKARNILSLNYIINKFFSKIFNNTNKFSVLLNLVIKFMNDNLFLYKEEFENNKLLKRKFIKSVSLEYNKEERNDINDLKDKKYKKISEDMIYTNLNRKKNLKYENEFYAISLPKLYSIFSIINQNENLSNIMKDCEHILEISEQFYDKLYELLKKDNQITETFFDEKNKDEFNDIINNFKGRFLKLPEILKIVYGNKIENNLNPVKRKKENKNKMNTKKIENLPKERERQLERSEIFVNYWNLMRKYINNPEKLKSFHNNVRSMINDERQNFIINLSNFIDGLEQYNKNIETNVENKNNMTKIHFLLIFHNVIKEFLKDNSLKSKKEIYFYYWILIHLMRFDFSSKTFLPESKDNKEFTYNNTPLNKELFNDQKFFIFALKSINKKNIKNIDYEMLVYFKFINAYLNGLDDNNKNNLFLYLINSQESEKLFLVMKNILENFKKKLTNIFNFFTQENEYIKISEGYFLKLRSKLKHNEISMNKFENELNPYVEVIQLISYLSDNNKIIHNKMKDYLRYQYNNNKSINFISILSSILDLFTKIKNDKNNNEFEFYNDRRIFIKFYYPVILNIIESLTKCCQGPSFENQNSLVKDTKILYFINQILFGLTYRKRLFDEDGKDIETSIEEKKNNLKNKNMDNSLNSLNLIENLTNQTFCYNIDLSRKNLSYLKYKLLLLLSVLTIGRKKGDKLYEIINREIDFDILKYVLEETYKEILIEKKCKDSPENLTFGDEIYLRFENFRINNENQIKNENNFIIFEIGTYIYILINIYYEFLSRLSNDNNYKLITYFKKELKKKKTQIKKSFILDNLFSFIQSFFRFLLSFFICFKYCNCKKKKEYENDFYLKDCFERSYSFYFDYTPNIEVVFNDNVTGYYVKLSPICKYLTDDMKEEFQSNLDRTNTKSKLECLFKNVDYYKYNLDYSQKIYELYKKIPFLDLFFNQYLFYKDLSLVISIAINFIIFSSYYRVDDDNFEYGFLYKEKNLKITKNFLKYLSYIQLVLSILIFINYILKNVAKYNYISNRIDDKNNKNKENISLVKKIFNFLNNMISDYVFLYNLVYLIFALIGVIEQNYLYFSFLLVEIIPRSTTLMYVIQSMWIPKKQLVATLFLFYLFEYYFVIFIYLYLADQTPHEDCLRFDDCLFTIFDQTFKNSNGIINYLDGNFLNTTKTLFKNSRFWIDNLYTIINILLILQMVAGIIIDNFSALRQNKGEIDEDRYNVCLICGLKRKEINKLYGNEEGYNEHIKMDHYFWNYMFLLFNLLRKDKKTLMAIDEFIYDCYNENQSPAWIPLKNCKKKNQIENKDNENI